MSDHQSEQHYNDLSVEQLFKEYKQAVEADDTITAESISSVVGSWDATKKLEYAEWCRLTDEWRPGVSWDVPADMSHAAEDDDFSLPIEGAAPPQKPKLSLHDLLELVKEPEYQHLLDGRTTVCMLHLKNGSTTVAHSQVLYAENNIAELGENQAYQNALEKMWDLVGFKHHQERYELELVKERILPGINSLGDGADTMRELHLAWGQVSPAVQLLASELSNEKMNNSPGVRQLRAIADITERTSPSSNHVSTWPSLEHLGALEETMDTMDEAALREALQGVIAGFKNYSGHVAKQQSALLRENSRLAKVEANPITNYRLTSRINMTAGNHPDGTVQQLRRQGGLIRDEVVELLGHLHMDALFKFDFVKMATKFQDAWGEAVGYGAVFDDEMDAALNGAEEFLKLHEYQKTLFTGEDLPGATIDPYAIRDDIQDILVTTYGLSHYMGYNADEDHKEVYRSNMTKFDPTMDLAKKTQEKYAALGVTTEIRLSHVKWEGFEGDYYINIVAETVVGSDGKTYPKGKFLKSINFEEPRYKPALRDLTVTSDHRLMAHYGEEPEELVQNLSRVVFDIDEGVEVGTRKSVIEKLIDGELKAPEGNLPVVVETDLNVAGSLTFHAPTHPGYFDDLKKSGENNVAFRTIMGREMRPHESTIAMVVGGERMARMAQIFDGGGLVQLSELGITQEMAKEALQRTCKGFAIHPDSYTPSDVGDFLREAYQLRAAYEADFQRKLEEAVTTMTPAVEEDALTFDGLLDKASVWLNAADNGTEFTGRLRSLKETDLVTEVLDDREKLFFSRVSHGLLMREDGSSRTLADFLYQVTKLPPIRTEEEE